MVWFGGGSKIKRIRRSRRCFWARYHQNSHIATVALGTTHFTLVASMHRWISARSFEMTLGGPAWRQMVTNPAYIAVGILSIEISLQMRKRYDVSGLQRRHALSIF